MVIFVKTLQNHEKTAFIHIKNLGNVKITESFAILRYLARKNNLYGCNAEEAAVIDMATYAAWDLKMELIKLVFDQDFEKKRDAFAAGLEAKFKNYSDFLGDKKWVAGDNLSMADFGFIDVVIWHHKFAPNEVEKFPYFMAFKERFEALPKIKEFQASDKNFSAFFAPMTKWGNK
jgi:glutathione S-transferase